MTKMPPYRAFLSGKHKPKQNTVRSEFPARSAEPRRHPFECVCRPGCSLRGARTDRGALTAPSNSKTWYGPVVGHPGVAMFERFTDGARLALVFAQQRVSVLGYNSIRAEARPARPR